MSVTYAGYLLKEGAGLVKTNKKRWFILKGDHLFYYKKQDDADPIGSISLKDTLIQSGPQNKFVISGPGLPRAYNLVVEDMQEKEVWIKSLQVAAVGPAVGSTLAATSEGEKMLLSASGEGVALSDFDVVKVIGRGSFGKVMKVKFKRDGQIYAMKALRKDVLVQENMVQNAKDEKNILQNISHPFIVKLHFAFQTSDRLYLVLDLLPGGEMFYHLKTSGCFSPGRAKLYAAQVASALSHLHAEGIIYRDLKPENIVLDKMGNACLTDMGLAKTKMNSGQQTYTFCGTPEYIAPEILKGTGHNRGVDWWALGILIYEMLCGLPPFYSENVDQMYDLILNKPLEFPGTRVDAEGRDLITKLLVRCPSKRLIDGPEIMKHPYFASIDFAKLHRKELTPEWVPDLSDGNDEKYVEDEFKELSTTATVFKSNRAAEDANFEGFDNAQ